ESRPLATPGVASKAINKYRENGVRLNIRNASPAGRFGPIRSISLALIHNHRIDSAIRICVIVAAPLIANFAWAVGMAIDLKSAAALSKSSRVTGSSADN